MRHHRSAAFTLALLAGQAVAQVPAPESGAGWHAVVTPITSRPRPWPGIATPVVVTTGAVRITIDEQIASTEVEFELWNPAASAQEAQILLPVPDGVTIRSFQYDGTGPEPTALVLTKEEARRIYDQIVRGALDPGLLEFAGLNAIRTSVFPVPAGARQKIRFNLEQALAADAGRVDYVFPRSEAVTAGSTRWTMSATVRSSRPIATVYSPTHTVATDRRGAGEFGVRVEDASANSPGSFRLSYVTDQGEGDRPATTIMAYPDPSLPGGHGGYFLMLAGFGPVKDADRVRTPRELTLVIDRSGSMRGEKIDQARKAAAQVIQGLDAGESFNIIDFSDSVATFAAGPVVKDPGSLERALKYVQNLEANGGTNIQDAVMEGLRPPPREGSVPIVLFMTDGLPTVGERHEGRLRDALINTNTHGRRIFSFGVGLDVNTPLLSALSNGSRGAPTFVLPGEDIEIKVSQVFRRLKGPIMIEPRLTGGDHAIRELQPARLPDVFDGDQIIVLGQYTDGRQPFTVRLDGSFMGQARSFEHRFDPAQVSARHGYVARLWARRKIASLIDQIRQGSATDPTAPPPKELVDEIVRLSTRFGVLTEYTSFLALEPGARDAAGQPLEPVQMSLARARASEGLADRLSARSGAASVNQELNTAFEASTGAAPQRNAWFGRQLERVEVSSVQMVGANAMFNRGQRWVDGRLLSQEQEPPEQVVEPGTPEFDAVVDDLVRQGIQSILTNQGDLYVLANGKRTLIRNGKP